MSTQQGFSVTSGKIIAPDGSTFAARGINLYAGGWTNLDGSMQASAATVLATFPGINMVRVEAYPNTNNGITAPTSLSARNTFIQTMTAAKVVVEIEDHSYPEYTAGDASWYASLAAQYKDNPYVWFGTPNEPSGSDPDVVAQEVSIYDAIRNTGNANPIMLELVGGGGISAEYSDPAAYAAMTNTIWDVHHYGLLSDGSYSRDLSAIASDLENEAYWVQGIKSADGTMPIIWGEYGISTNGGTIDANATQLLPAVQSRPDSGSLACGWNAGADALTNGNGTLTAYGNEVASYIASAAANQDTLDIAVSEDAWKGDAQFTVSVDGKLVGGIQTAHVIHGIRDDGHVLLTGDWGSGQHDFKITFINDAYGGTPQTDRNLYVDSISLDGKTYAGTSGTFLSDGSQSFTLGGAMPVVTPALDTLVLHLSEDAWKGNAQFQVSIDGKAIDTRETVTALHSGGKSQEFIYTGNFGTGSHDVGVSFVNAATGRNLYVGWITFNSNNYSNWGKATPITNGTAHFTVFA